MRILGGKFVGRMRLDCGYGFPKENGYHSNYEYCCQLTISRFRSFFSNDDTYHIFFVPPI